VRRSRLLSIAFGLTLLTATVAVAADPPKPDVKGLWFVTDFPSVNARPGESATLKLKLQNYNLPPERAALSIRNLPEGWQARFLGVGLPVAAAVPGTNESINLLLRVDVPAGAPARNQTLLLEADAASARSQLPIDVVLSDELPARLSLKPKLPSLSGTSRTSFDFQLTVGNDSGKDLLVRVAAEAPRNFQTSFTEGFGSQEISSVPIEAGQTKDLKIKVTPPSDIPAGDYRVVAVVSAEGAKAEAPLTLNVTGQPKLRLTGADGRLSGSAEAGRATPITLTVANDGTLPTEEVELGGTPPTDWKVEFNPKKIDRLGPGEKREVQALLTPASKAIAGDYMTSFRASAKGDSSSADYRVTVTTSTMWGAVGIAVIAAALLVVVGAVARFGRR
jgi:uncharacterized membrane protein